MAKTKAVTVEGYLQALPPEQRQALEALRARILSAAPQAVEYIGYGMPGFKLGGHPLFYIGAAKGHCALYGSVPEAMREALKGHDTGPGTVRFTVEKPLPATLVKALVKAKMAENAARWPSPVAKRKGKATPRRTSPKP